jgi:pimeloyl-ACP methyl ester carboxylesterase
MATFVVCHGAWSAGWAWKKMHPLLRGLGHELYVPTYTGLGERGHLASPHVDLETHVSDVLGTLHCEDLRGVILVGHSYGGMVATSVADRAADRLSHLVYLDAFVPRDGESLSDLRPGQPAHAGGSADWLIAPNPLPPDTREEDAAWIMPRRFAHPRRCFEQKSRLTGTVDGLPRTYIYCTRPAPGDGFRVFARRAQAEGWHYLEIDSSHNPHITVPGSLARLLDGVAHAAADKTTTA